MFGISVNKEVIEFSRDEGYMLCREMEKAGWKILHDFEDGEILSKIDTYLEEDTIAFMDYGTTGYEYIAFHGKRYSEPFIDYAIRKNGMEALYFKSLKEHTIDWFPVSDVIIVDGTPAILQHHYDERKTESIGNEEKRSEDEDEKLRKIRERVNAFCKDNGIEASKSDISFIARHTAALTRMDDPIILDDTIESLVNDKLNLKTRYADPETTFRAEHIRREHETAYFQASNISEARKKAEKYFSSSEEYYSEDEISIHCISEEELVREEDVRV